ncbi:MULTISPECIES: FMN-binding negative transcriptional regulator [Rhodopseudomonas]|uniref:Negative transcriptional regulator n=1 Tax=Rhodopseudomonas palustris TaxID=1076 RepID=A0A0D7EVR6_RHOPL|nr:MULTISPECIES: FMN-binding negative transcriptional regulator [Rhodopseudomonas]KIZ44721.1 negative transcriptional regulator [Rhodopseudomonas palustris]MDF3813485.1 FMN-binding negative transcriptional regulator [Rhodopseudomonas sp. BAL398]WOK18687.1 FMN-binding negative transcriptional regulator [Rhodopseudomonas sp. BAL398]
MYAPPKFQPDRSACLAFAAARGFGTICAWDGGRPEAAPVPFAIDYSSDGTPLLSFHLARNNPLTRIGNGRNPWLMAVNGADAYVSANWYVSPDQVPTWLYQSVHLTGPVALMSDTELADHLDAVTASFESSLPQPHWSLAAMPAGRREAMKQAIVGVMMRVDRVEGSFKLNQHKSDADHEAVATALARQADPAAQAVAAQMIALRPRLDYRCGVAVGEPAL